MDPSSLPSVDRIDTNFSQLVAIIRASLPKWLSWAKRMVTENSYPATHTKLGCHGSEIALCGQVPEAKQPPPGWYNQDKCMADRKQLFPDLQQTRVPRISERFYRRLVWVGSHYQTAFPLEGLQRTDHSFSQPTRSISTSTLSRSRYHDDK